MSGLNLTYPDIAFKVLRETKAKSMHYRDITRKAFELELIESDDVITAGSQQEGRFLKISRADITSYKTQRNE